MTQEATQAPKEYVVEISFLHMQPVETAVLMLGNSEEEVREVVTKLFHKRQDLVIASVHEKPKGYRDNPEEAMTMENTTEEITKDNVVQFTTKKDLN